MSTFHSLEPNPTLRGTDVTQLRKARRSVEAPDLRPVFGCAWCGPPQPNAEETLCPLCLPLQQEGWSRRVNAQSETKVFTDGCGTKFPSKKAFLEESTSIVGERIKEMEEGERGALLGKLHAFEIEEEKEKETPLPRAPSERVKCDAGEDAPRLPQPQQPKISVSTDFKVGDRVRAFWVNDTPCSDARWCEGTIHSINGNGTYRVKFPDDSKSCPRVLIVPEGEFAPFTDAVRALRVGDRVHAPRWDSESGTSELASHPPTWLGAVITKSEGSGTRRAFRVRFDGDGKKISGIKASLVFPWREGMPEEPPVGKEEGKKRSVGKMRGVKREEKKPKRNKVCTNIEFGGSAASPGKQGLPRTAGSGEAAAGHSPKRQKMQRFEVGEIPTDVYLSLKDETYKTIMFSKFQDSEAGTAEGGNAYLAQQVMRVLEAGGTERFFRSQGYGKNAEYVEVDRKSALAKISSDFSRRTESYPIWGADPDKIEAVKEHMREKCRRNQQGESIRGTRLQDAGLPGLHDVDSEGYGYYCFICQDGGEIMLCDTCTNACHLECHYPELTKEPDNFFCVECAKEEVFAFWQCDGRIACSLGEVISVSYKKKKGGKALFCDVKLSDSDEVMVLENTFVIPKAHYHPDRVYEEGDRVLAPWSRKNGDPKWFVGSVKSAIQEGEKRRYMVKFDNSGKKDTRVVDADQLIPVMNRPSDNKTRRSVKFDDSGGRVGIDEDSISEEGAAAPPPPAAAAPRRGSLARMVSRTKSEQSSIGGASAPRGSPAIPSEIGFTSPEVTRESISLASIPSFPHLDEKDPLLLFLRSQSACIKGNVEEFYAWLVTEDVVGMPELKDAVSDEDYLSKMKYLKGFKRAAFQRAVAGYENVEPTESAAPPPQNPSNTGSASTNEMLFCPIGKVLMTEEPVLASDGMTYERAHIENWFRERLAETKTARENMKHNRASESDREVAERGVYSPVYGHGTKITDFSCKPNTQVKNMAIAYRDAQRSPAASGTVEGQPKLERITSL